MCTRDERNWASRDEFTLRSMAQTRASAKALRNVLAWVAVLGGFKPTPVEEMPSDIPRTYVANRPAVSTVHKEALEREEGRKRAGINYVEDSERTVLREAHDAIRPEEYADAPESYQDSHSEPQSEVVMDDPAENVCRRDGCGKKVTDKVRDYSVKMFGATYCYEHQPKKRSETRG